MESYVLPTGAAKLPLKELATPQGHDRLKTLAGRAEPGARLAQETTGPAASYAPLSHRASGSTPAQAFSPTGPGAAAPEPPRTMTYDECKKGLGSDNKFYVKSRFAACDGASFVQEWLMNGRPAGASMFNVRVVGTIARDSRTIDFQYYFTDFETTGETGALSMPITTKGTVPKTWPSGARFTRGGNAPGTMTWAQLEALRTFHETVNAKPGQGSGRSDLLAAVYEPLVSFKPPAPWKLSGATQGTLFMLAPRWDAASYLPNSTGGRNPATKGAATFSYITAMVLSARAGAEERAEAQHIKTAFTHPEDTKPYMSAKKVPGQNVEDPLHRTVDAKRNDDNRNAAKKQCRRYWGAGYSHGNTRDCDEYPFASTYEGAAEHDYDPEVRKFNFSVKPIAKEDNQAGGLILKSFYSKNRILDGQGDAFIVEISG
ncbi:hypothetical protein A6P39_000655 [Streptomyces sp. FXJ1.172]|uniref:NucA/NucB deoxyribonuclease domain-containing protein n=1 Tax=Streptomyces sp. FXJ1.172 TaxID=710705 RepID=UPI000B0FB21D|nr:hypothetical protein [Streptomyces sp. FXJ1.172]WEO92751.1 hypothetical protein A6P39_000655 [Streptomyces sp. FXJ1.172]